ncbi:MAG: F0F1 ATP synthase subunit epsilon [Parcubacteria group bacterium]|nr:F0F1 ATP synthase subunit epsilon [Parcubacteria group bacterium]
MKLTIYSLKGIEFQGEASAFNVKTASGEITILDHHRPLITLLKKCDAFITVDEGKKEKKSIRSGFLEVTPHNSVNVLID